MVKIAILADMHLPYVRSASQYRALRFGVESIKKSDADALVCLGDITACGETEAADTFNNIISEIDLPKIITLGNSDIRTKENITYIKELKTESELNIKGINIVALDSCDCELSEQDELLLQKCGKNSIIFLHHPPERVKCTKKPTVAEYINEINPIACVYGHIHIKKQDGIYHSVQSLDPDKAKHSPPCVTYITIENQEVQFEYDYFPTNKPRGLENYIGISCFDTLNDIDFAIKERVLNIELRPNAVDIEIDALKEKISAWRSIGGKCLSLHMPNIKYTDSLLGKEDFEKAVSFANEIGVNRVTVHVPRIEVARMAGKIKEEILSFVVSALKKLPKKCEIGIENLHMGKNDKDDLHRGFGFLPEECIQYVKDINRRFGFERVGILLDVGHARNNLPYSDKYTLSVWYETVGSMINGYHIHQVISEGDSFKNHAPITSVFGPAISYASFSDCWNKGVINKKPVFLEIRGGQENYLLSLNAINKWK